MLPAPACNSRPRTKRANALQLWRWTAWWVIQLVIARLYDRTPCTGKSIGTTVGVGVRSAFGAWHLGLWRLFSFFPGILFGGALAFVIARLDFVIYYGNS